ncbi:site-specific integrase [Aliarcobacter butzleri]|uniref:site-specific integrase n=1 Tax=Aliarcobacter butzleri TaxID=28197 RepID=UPI00125FE93B|nr:site-specific integrase [Aliarcobacter butzleri]
MRGSVYYQSSQLVKQIFEEGAKKQDKINPNHENYQKVSSYKTMESYRRVWNNFFNYLKEHWKIRDFEKIESQHIQAYMDYKIEYYPSKQYLEKISAALGKLEIALKLFAKNIHNKNREYDFSIRQTILDQARDLKFVANNYHNRAYDNPKLLIFNLKNSVHQLAAKIQLEGGARIEGVALIKPEQLLGIRIDKVTKTQKGIIFTKEKGGKQGEDLVSLETYTELENYLSLNSKFKINRQDYYNDIKQAALISKEIAEGSHGLRWNFAKRRMFEHGKAGYSYSDSLQQVSYEMKHNRASITEHYLG